MGTLTGKEEEKRGMFMGERRVKGAIVIVGVTAGIYWGIRYLLPFVIPFFVAFLLAVLLEPVVEKIRRKLPFNRGVIAAALLLIAGGLILGALWILAGKLVGQLRYLVSHFDLYEEQLSRFLTDCCKHMEGLLGICAAQMEEFILQNIGSFAEEMQTNFLPGLMTNSVQYLKGAIECLGIGIMILIAVILFVKDYKEIIKFHKKYFYYEEIKGISKRVLRVGLEYLKAQVTIMFVIAAVCTTVFFLMGNPYALLLGTGIGILDALPILGTGMVLIPWGLISFLRGKYIVSIILFGLSFLCNMTREFLEPKLVGERLGLHPIVVLAAVYTGICLFGLSGVVTGPIGFIVGREIVADIFEKTGWSLE